MLNVKSFDLVFTIKSVNILFFDCALNWTYNPSRGPIHTSKYNLNLFANTILANLYNWITQTFAYISLIKINEASTTVYNLNVP